MTSMANISPNLLKYLQAWFTTATKQKIKSGNVVDLSFAEFLDLFQKHQLASLQKAIDANRIRYLQDEKNSMAYVLTWVSYAACSSRVFNKETATVCARWKSAQINLPQKGDELRPEHREAIAKGLQGKAKTEDHKKAISDGSKGVRKAGWSQERKDERSRLRREQEAAKKAASLVGIGGVA